MTTDEEVVRRPRGRRSTTNGLRTEADFRARAAKGYTAYSGTLQNRFKWLPSSLFIKDLAKDLLSRFALACLSVLQACGDWNPDARRQAGRTGQADQEARQGKTAGLHPVRRHRPLSQGPVGRTWHQTWKKPPAKAPTPPHLAWRFSPVSNDKRDRSRPPTNCAC
jgi:hypothetical protein